MVRRILTGTAVVALALTVAGCGSDSDSSSSTTTSAQSAVCKDKTALEDSVKSLTNLDLATAGEGKIDSDAQDVQDNLDALGKSVKANLKPEVDALKAAVQDLRGRGQGLRRPEHHPVDPGRAAARSRRWARRARTSPRSSNDQCPS